MDHDELVRILHEQVKPAVGCTEPVAVALAAATAYAQTGGEIEEIDIKVSLNIYKNGMRVGVPGTEGKGIPFAAALAVICGKPKLKLELFREVDEACENRARKLLDRRIIRIRTVKERDETAKDGDQFAIDVLVRTDRGTGECSIRYEHTNIVQIKQNGAVVFSEDQAGSEKKGSTGPENITLSLEEILQIAEEADLKKLRFLLEGVDMNLKISDAGRAERYSSGMGQELFGLMVKGVLAPNLPNRIRAAAAAATDARMAGLNLPVMSSAGSGNHGITAIIPVALTAREYRSSENELIKALLVSHLVTASIKSHTGRLSPVCGCAVAAGIGASAGIAMLLGGSQEQIGMTIQNMIGSLSGMVCDGAKGGCSYKVATASTEAYYQALLASRGVYVSSRDGIVGETPEESIENLGRLSREGMKETDVTIIDIMNAASPGVTPFGKNSHENQH